MGLEQSGQNKETGKDRLGGKLALLISIFFKKQKPGQKYCSCYKNESIHCTICQAYRG